MIKNLKKIKEIIRVQPFTIDEYINMKEKLNSNKLKISEYEIQLENLSTKYTEIKTDIDLIRKSVNIN